MAATKKAAEQRSVGEPKKETAVDIDSIVTRLEATAHGTEFLRGEWEKQWPGTHFYLAHKFLHNGKHDPGAEVRFKKAQGYEELSDDTMVAGHPEFVLMGIPQEAYDQYQRRKRERTEKGLMPKNPRQFDQALQQGEGVKLKDADAEDKNLVATVEPDGFE